jgi:hypothetical protein
VRFSTILKQTFYLFLASITVGFCWAVLIKYIGLPVKELPAVELYLWIVLAIIIYALWGLYRAMYEHYGDLNHAPLYWLILLFIASFVSNMTRLYGGMYCQLELVFIPKFFIQLFKNGNLLVYVCAIQLFLAEIAIKIAQWSVTLRTFQTLKKQLWDKNHSTGI